jgi:putative hemin transport protein
MEKQTTKELYETFKRENPEARIRDAATKLLVSEAELLICQLNGAVTRLNDTPEDILKTIEELGEVMALTRNHACVHERKGVYENPQFFTHGQMKTGLFVNPDIDLRLFMAHWAFAFAVEELTKAGLRQSIQFFDKTGDAIHKIYLTSHSDKDAYTRLVETFKNADQALELELTAYPEKAPDAADADVNWQGLRTAWENMKDVHEFFPMLRKFGVGREQAFQNVGADFALEISNDAGIRAIELASEKECEIMVFVGNRGCIQIHTGPTKKVVDFNNWFNVLDPKFNLHLNVDAISRTWVTRKPTADGIITAVELFDADGEIIATLFGKRKQGDAELELWREIVSLLPEKKEARVA